MKKNYFCVVVCSMEKHLSLIVDHLELFGRSEYNRDALDGALAQQVSKQDTHQTFIIPVANCHDVIHQLL